MLSPPRGYHPEDAARPGADGIIREHERAREANRFARLHHLGANLDPLADLRAADEIDGQADRHQARRIPKMSSAAQSHRVVSERRDQPAMDESTTVRVCGAGPDSQTDAALEMPRVNRLPRGGEAAPARMELEALRNALFVQLMTLHGFADDFCASISSSTSRSRSLPKKSSSP